MFSDTGRNWKQYKQEDSIWAFTGNTNADSVVQQKLQHSVKTRFLRFVPLEWNPSGRIGLRVEVYGCIYKSDVADFDGRSSLLYRFNQKQMSTFKDVISLKFKSMQGDGVLFHGEGQRGDYITLELQKGKLSLHINLGDTKLRSSNGHTLVTLGSLLDDQHWHSVSIERFNKQVNFTVDKYTQHFRSKGDADHLDLDYELSFGGIPVPGKPGTFLRKNFHGCIENLYYNGGNIIDLAKRRKPQIYIVGNVTFSCSEPQSVPITFLSSSNSYLLLPGIPQLDGLSVSFQFRTWNKDGLLLSTELSEDSGLLLLYLLTGKLILVIQKVAENSVKISTGSNLNDGLWHTVNVNARRHRITLTLDNDAASPVHANLLLQIYSGNNYYFGGCPDNFTDSQCLNPVIAFQGCLRLISIDNQPKDLILVQQGSLGNFSDLHIDLCSIKDRCLPNYCEHGGTCSQSWTTFFCDCADTGYTGATCHNSIYQQSCEIYRHMGKTSGFFYIDSDGSGPLVPFHVYCNITDKVWTTVKHNNPGLIKVQGSDTGRPYSMHLSYNGSTEQLEGMINGAEYCEQEAAYHCRKSRLLNSPNGAPFTWWVGRANEKHVYWGGSIPEVQQCSCGLEESCLDTRHFCNCDADRNEWTNDTGLLSFKDHLPVTQIVITDTNRSNSEAAWRIGPLRCYGDRKFWNAASFTTEASYLHFPTLHAEISTDISFFFKTTASSGVFLENLGTKDFIRIEMSSPSAVTFSFDVGNGPTEVTVQSVTPLNDNQWHYVRADRNVKETLLQVDNLPPRVLPSTSEGHFRLQLNSQLFVEVSAIFEAGTSITYLFQEPYPVTKNLTASSSAIYADTVLSKESISLSFLTAQAPSLLLYLDSFYQDYMAVILCHNGSLQVRYKLSNDGPYIFTIDSEKFTNKQIHHVKINREGKELSIQVDQILRLKYNFSVEIEFKAMKSLILGKVTDTSGLDAEVLKANSIGFIGCLSSVQYNHLAPLKAALRHPSIAPVTIKGPLSEGSCESIAEADADTVTTTYSSLDHSSTSDKREPFANEVRSDSAVIGGVIAVVIFILFCIVAIMAKFLYQHKETRRKSRASEKDYPENLDTSFRNELDLQNTVSECKKEYFI
ncbi:contactin-associated protein-like 5 isoform X4 [Microcaecilia unicolor]|uniref:Contactin-associated protein-like 5 isoform X4 n=1 Tax=Microcaecilia unicolor TaxID=1415580 RepID=A0A6P7YQ47_9AMPH|nr:contactin-associated protein-like 5 isoform X4 [Microcaecilia unicolor]